MQDINLFLSPDTGQLVPPFPHGKLLVSEQTTLFCAHISSKHRADKSDNMHTVCFVVSLDTGHLIPPLPQGKDNSISQYPPFLLS